MGLRPYQPLQPSLGSGLIPPPPHTSQLSGKRAGCRWPLSSTPAVQRATREPRRMWGGISRARAQVRQQEMKQQQQQVLLKPE